MTTESWGSLQKSDTLTERVRSELSRRLIAGYFKPGQKIKIREVAAALDVSPTPVRGALTHLIGEGALVADSNNTAVVPLLTQAALDEITALRLALEPVAAASACTNISPDDHDRLAALDTACVRAAEQGDVQRATEFNADFHFTIYAKARLPLLLRMIETTWLRHGAFLAVGAPSFGPDMAKTSRHPHILAALRRGEAAALQQAITEDIRGSQTALRGCLQSLQAFAAD